MSAISLRIEAGLSIRDLAELMGISRSSVGHYEKGLRHLPAIGSLRYTQLQLAWIEFCSNKIKPAIVLSEAREKQLNKTLEALVKAKDDADFQIKSLNRLLEPMQKRYHKLEIKLLFIQALKNEDCKSHGESILQIKNKESKTTGKNRHRRRKKFLQIKEDNVLTAMRFCGPEKQENLIFRLGLAKAKGKLAEEALQRLRLQQSQEEHINTD